MIDGTYFDGQTSQRHAARLEFVDKGLVHLRLISEDAKDQILTFSTEDINISSRLGNTTRYINFQGGAIFETSDNAAIDQFVKIEKGEIETFSPYKWESKGKFIAIAAVLFCLVIFVLLKFGIPTLSKGIAMKLSPEVSKHLALEVLSQLDENYFEESNIDPIQRRKLTALFEQHIPADAQFDYSLHFRKGNLIGPNALALPDGSAIVTDELVELAESDEEIIAVLLHEIGHVRERHGLRRAIESVGIYAIYTMATGDIEASSPILLYIPAVLIQLKFSRDHETEADDFALERMLENDIDPLYFATIMEKLSAYKKFPAVKDKPLSMPEQPEDTDENLSTHSNNDKNIKDVKDKSETVSSVLQYLSSHPPSAERIEKFKKASETNYKPAEK